MTDQAYIERVAIQFHRYMVQINTDDDLTYPTCFENFKASSWFTSISPAMTDTTTIRMTDETDYIGPIPLVDCCGIGPITNEKYCPECGKRIIHN